MSPTYIRAKHIARARNLRDTSTEVEKRLWARLRDRQLEGFKFRRQHTLLGYVLDFACNEAMLAVELDGSQHGEVSHQAHDEKRSAELARLGWKVLRFWNNEVTDNMRGVLEVIRAELLARHPHPTRSSSE